MGSHQSNRESDDIFAAGVMPDTVQRRTLWWLIRHGPLSADDIAARMGRAVGDVLAALAVLVTTRCAAVDADRYRFVSPQERYERSVTLHDGREVGSWSREWLAECEARAVLRLPSKMFRNGYILRARNRRGDIAANELEELCRRIWRADRLAEQWCG
jgi:hypothetical protein